MQAAAVHTTYDMNLAGRTVEQLDRKVEKSLAWIVRETREAALDPVIRRAAADIVSGLPHRDHMAQAAAITDWMRANGNYLFDAAGSEELATPRYILSEIQAGRGNDCDASVLQGALLMSIGIPVRYLTWSADPNGAFQHVTLQAHVSGRWILFDWVAFGPEARKILTTGRQQLWPVEVYPGNEGIGRITVSRLKGESAALGSLPQPAEQGGVLLDLFKIATSVLAGPDDPIEPTVYAGEDEAGRWVWETWPALPTDGSQDQQEALHGLLAIAGETFVEAQQQLDQVAVSPAMLARVKGAVWSQLQGNMNEFQRLLVERAKFAWEQMWVALDEMETIEEEDAPGEIWHQAHGALGDTAIALKEEAILMMQLYALSRVLQAQGKAGAVRAALFARERGTEGGNVGSPTAFVNAVTRLLVVAIGGYGLYQFANSKKVLLRSAAKRNASLARTAEIGATMIQAGHDEGDQKKIDHGQFIMDYAQAMMNQADSQDARLLAHIENSPSLGERILKPITPTSKFVWALVALSITAALSYSVFVVAKRVKK